MSDIRIMIANQDAFTRQLLEAIFGQKAGFRVVGTFESVLPVTAALRQMPDVLFVDLTEPHHALFDDVHHWRRECPTCSIIVCTLPDAPDLSTLHFIQNGFSDRLRCPDPAHGLMQALLKAENTVLAKVRRLVNTNRVDTFERVPTTLYKDEPKTLERPRNKALSLREATSSSFERIRTNLERAEERLARVSSGVIANKVVPAHKPGVGSPFKKFDLVTLGISTGGPQALMSLLQGFEKPLPVPMLIVQHMPPDFTRILAQRLNSSTALEVAEAVDGEVLRPGRVLIAPGDFHMTLQRDNGALVVSLSQGERVNGCRPAVDILWNSVSEIFGSACLAVIMTGMGKDGLEGARGLRERGATILAQDEGSSVIWGMPGAVVREGLADDVLPLTQLADAISSRLRRSSSPFLAMEDAP